MQTKHLIFTADDLGNGKEINEGILRGVRDGLLSSTCIMANGIAFEEAVDEILPQIKNAGMGVHLDIIENKSLLNKNSKSLLCDPSGQYNVAYPQMIRKSNDKNFLAEIEADFRAQIEKILDVVPVDHINSHVHTHAIPPIFEITCKLAKEYGIKCVRTQYEKNYFTKGKNLNLNYPVNMVKVLLLNTFSLINKVTAKNYGIITNDSFVGVRYTGFMDRQSVLDGLKAASDSSSVEVLVHPYFCHDLENMKKDSKKFGEYLLTQDEDLKNEIVKLNYSFSVFRDIS